MANFPYIQFFTGDWLKDPKLSICSPATRGVWIDLLCAMHELDRSGQLRGTTEQIARVARCSTEELAHALAELQTTGAADVTERNGVVTVENRRMAKEYKARAGTRLRVERYRENGHCNGAVAPPVTAHSTEVIVQNQKSIREGTGSIVPVVSRPEKPSPPVFEPLRRGLFLKEYEVLLKNAEGELKKIKEDKKSWNWELRGDVMALIKFLEQEKKEQWEEKIKEVKAFEKNYDRKSMKPAALACANAWKDRITEIKRAMNGQV